MDPILGLWLVVMGSIVSGIGISLWLAIREGRRSSRRWTSPEMMSYICFDCNYKVSLPVGGETLEKLVAISDLHQEVSHGDSDVGR